MYLYITLGLLWLSDFQGIKINMWKNSICNEWTDVELWPHSQKIIIKLVSVDRARLCPFRPLSKWNYRAPSDGATL